MAGVSYREGAVKVGVHLGAANEVHHPNAQPPGAVKDPEAPAGDTARIVGGAENVGAVV